MFMKQTPKKIIVPHDVLHRLYVKRWRFTSQPLWGAWNDNGPIGPSNTIFWNWWGLQDISIKSNTRRSNYQQTRTLKSYIFTQWSDPAEASCVTILFSCSEDVSVSTPIPIRPSAGRKCSLLTVPTWPILKVKDPLKLNTESVNFIHFLTSNANFVLRVRWIRCLQTRNRTLRWNFTVQIGLYTMCLKTYARIANFLGS